MKLVNNNFLNRIPLNKQRILGLSLVALLLVVIPVLIWALVTQTFNPGRRAGVLTEPLTINETFDGTGSPDMSKWKSSGPIGSTSKLENGKLVMFVPGGSVDVGGRVEGSSIVSRALVNSEAPQIPGIFNVSVDIDLIDVQTDSAWAGLKFTPGVILRRNKSPNSDSIELLTNPSNTTYSVVSAYQLPPGTNAVKLRLVRSQTEIQAFFNVGTGDIHLTSVSDPVFLQATDTLPVLILQNGLSNYPEATVYFDNYYATANMLIPGQSPTPTSYNDTCTAVDKIITVTPIGDTTTTCHSIQAAIDSVTGDGYTILINKGDYNIQNTITIANKTNLSIIGNIQSDPDEVWLSFNSGGWGIKISNSSGTIERMHLEGLTSNGMLSITGSTDFNLNFLRVAARNSHAIDVQSSQNVLLQDVDVESSANAIEIQNSDNITVTGNIIHNSENGIYLSSVNNAVIERNIILDNGESGIYSYNIANTTIDHNTILNNSLKNFNPAILLSGSVNALNFTNNIVINHPQEGIKFTGLSFTGNFSHNDVWGNTAGNYVGTEDYTGTNGNISEDPLIDFRDGSNLCLGENSPAAYGLTANFEYMGHIGSCIPITNPPPTPSPTPAPFGDVNEDGRVNIIDIGIVVDNYRISPIPNPRADINNDGIVNIVDIGIIVDNYE